MAPKRKAPARKKAAEDAPAMDAAAEVPAEPPPQVAPATESPSDPVILQLPIAPARLQTIMENTNMHGFLEYNPNIVDPQPYAPDDAFHSHHDMVEQAAPMAAAQAPAEAAAPVSQTQIPSQASTHNCYWCCHSIPHIEYGMPIRYDVFHKSFTLFGSFCSLECAAAYNFATHMGSDRVWEIHTWIQMLAHRYGYAGHVRPAPSRFLLRMFNGPLTIDEFRAAHQGLARTFLLNIPPFIHVVSQMEVLNTSFFDKNGGHEAKKAPKRKTAAVTKGAFAVSEDV
jgi:hypothetical protein